ncbi:MAG: tetratricopeptide repeat protein [Myxococcota bacterium]
MNVLCAACSTQYQIDVSKVPASGGFLRCKTCGERIRIPSPGAAAEESAIPLDGAVDDDAPTKVGGSPPPQPKAAASGAIPLPGTGADKPPPASDDTIALAGTTDDDAQTQVTLSPPSAAIPLSGGADDSPTVTTDDDDEPVPVALRTIPPAGSKDGAADAADVPTPLSAIPPDGTGDSDDDAPTAISSPPKFLDDLPGTVPDPAPPAPYDDLPGLDDLPPIPPRDATASAPVARPGLDDLPGPLTGDVHEDETVVKQVDVAVFDDLPGIDDGSQASAASDTPDFSDVLPVADDLPVEASLDLADDGIPVADAPRLMDDLQEGDTAQTLEPEAPGSGPIPELEPLTREPGKAITLSRPTEAPSSNTGKIIIAAAVGVVLLAGTGVTFLTPVFGLQLVGGEEAPPDSSTPVDTAPEDPKAPPDDGTNAKPPDETPPEEAAPQEPHAPVLADRNVDVLSYAELKPATDAHATAVKEDDAEGQALLAWARFRLATTFGDEEAGKLLTAKLPKAKEIAKLNGLAAAAAVGALAYAGKTGPARKVGERLLKTKARDSPQLALAVASTYTRQPETQKAIRALDRALMIAPNMGDARLARARWQIGSRKPDEGVRSLRTLVKTNNDPDIAIRIAEILLKAGKLGALDKTLETADQPNAAELVAPARRSTFFELMAHRRVRVGNLDGAVEAATAWAAATPQDVTAAIQLARLTATTGGDARAVLDAALKRLTAPLDKGHIVAEQVRLALATGKSDEARAALEAGGKAARAKDAAPWLKMAEGWIALHEKNMAAARVAFNAAGRGKAKLIEPRLALVLLSQNKPGPTLKKLTELITKHGLPGAMYHSARLMKERGNVTGAEKLLNEVLWLDPTVVDSVQLLLEWADLLDQSGKKENAQQVITALYEARKTDGRPVLQLIAIAKRGKRAVEVLGWHRALVTARPNDDSAKIALARVLVDAGEPKEAQLLLDQLFKDNPKARTAPAIMALAAAWVSREPYKAKELIREAIDKEPLATSYLLMGDVEAGNTKYDKAEIAYKKALEIDPKLAIARVHLAAIHFEGRNFERAVEALQKVVAKHPSNREATELLGDALFELNRSRDALASYQDALAVAGDDSPLLMKIARLQMQRLNQLPPAMRTLRRAIKVEPELADAHYYLGLALKDTGRSSEARHELQAYVRLSPDGEFANDARRIVSDLENR